MTLGVQWAGGQRLDLQPAGCADPQCEEDHGYTGTAAREDLVIRVAADAEGQARLTPAVIEDIVALVPDDWLQEPDIAPAEQRTQYVQFLTARLADSATFVAEAEAARHALV